jgi:hypothetical protein
VSRNLGAPFGAAIGFLFFLGTSLAATMYVLGAVEAFQVGFGMTNLFFMDREIISLCVMLVLALIVYVGVEWVSRTMYIFLTIVILSIVLGIGGLIAFGSGASFGGTGGVSHSANGPLWTSQFTPDADTGITPSFQSLVALFYPSVTGIMAGSNRSGLLADPSKSIPIGTLGAVATTTVLYILVVFLFGSFVDVVTLKANKLVFASVAWPVPEVVNIGIIASSIGAGMQSLVGAPQLLATMMADDVLPFVPATQNAIRSVSSCCCSTGSSGAAKAVPTVPQTVPHPDVQETYEDRIGGMEALSERRLSAPSDATPELTTGDEEDGLADSALAGVPSLDQPAAPPKRGVAGFREIAITWLLASLPCLAGNLDFITPIQTQFFLMMYATVNLACLLNTFYFSPSFRPAWGVHWFFPALGMVWCLVIMMLVQWWQALIAIAIAVGLYQWVRQGEQADEWGSWGASLASVTFGQARNALLALRDLPPSANTWRPQLLVLASTDSSGRPTRPELLLIAGHLKKSRGVTMATSVVKAKLVSMLNKVDEDRRRSRELYQSGKPCPNLALAKDSRAAYEIAVGDPQRELQSRMADCGADGFAQIVVAESEFDALEASVQASGISAFRPNSVLLGWPRDTRSNPHKARSFVTLCKSILRVRKSLIVVKFDDDFARVDTPQSGFIDLYWMGSDSGLILLLPFLLTRHPVWRNCKLRLFAVDPALAGRKTEVERYLSAMRIPASVFIVPVEAGIIDESLSGRTMTEDVAAQLQAQLREAQGRLPESVLSSPAKPVPTEVELATTSPGAVPSSSMTMILGQPSAQRRRTGGRSSVFEVFGSPHPSDKKDEDGAAPDKEKGEDGAAPDKEKGEDVAATDKKEVAPAPTPAKPKNTLSPIHDDDDDDDDDEEAAPTAAAVVSTKDVSVGLKADGPEGETSFVRSARKMNELILEKSKDSALVIASLMLTRDKDSSEFLRYTEAFCKGVPRAILVRGTGHEVLTAVG